MKKGIICIETECELTIKKNRLDLNSELLMQFLSKSCNIQYIYRRVATIEELRYYFKQLSKKEYSDYNIIYFSFHGDTQGISLESGKFLTLEELAAMTQGLFEGKYVHFGSCRTMLGSQVKLDDFCSSSKAKMVTGFTKSVDPVLSAIHDAALINEILKCKHSATVIAHMSSLYDGLQQKLGFRYALKR